MDTVGAGCNRENFGGGGRLFAMLPVLLNHLTESTFPSPTCSYIDPEDS